MSKNIKVTSHGVTLLPLPSFPHLSNAYKLHATASYHHLLYHPSHIYIYIYICGVRYRNNLLIHRTDILYNLGLTN